MPKKLVSERALIRRINRKLEPELQQLKKSRDEKMRQDVGEFYVLDLNRNAIIEMHVDLEQMGRKLGVLGEFEELEVPT